jgi:anti-sigma factor RsiW
MHPTDFTLNEYLDNELAPADHDAVRAHLATCAGCRTLLSALDDVIRSAAALGPLPPPSHICARLDRAIEAAPGTIGGWSRRGSLGALAAAAVLLIGTLVGVRLSTVPRQAAPALSALTRSSDDPAANLRTQEIAAALRQSEAPYQSAIAGLEQLANAEQGALDAETAASLWAGFAVIDRAIGESRAALAIDPQSGPAQEGLLNALKTKMTLLENTVALINAAGKSREG